MLILNNWIKPPKHACTHTGRCTLLSCWHKIMGTVTYLDALNICSPWNKYFRNGVKSLTPLEETFTPLLFSLLCLMLTSAREDYRVGGGHPFHSITCRRAKSSKQENGGNVKIVATPSTNLWYHSVCSQSVNCFSNSIPPTLHSTACSVIVCLQLATVTGDTNISQACGPNISMSIWYTSSGGSSYCEYLFRGNHFKGVQGPHAPIL